MKMSLGRLDLENRRDVDHNLLLGRRHSHSLNIVKQNFNGVNSSMSNYLGLMIFWGLPRCLHHFFSSAFCSAHSLSSRLWFASTPLLLLVLVVVPWYWNFQKSGIFCCHWALRSPVASPGLSSGTPVLPQNPRPLKEPRSL